MKKIPLFFVTAMLINAVLLASALSGPQISVVAEMTGSGVQEKTTDGGRTYNEAYIDFKILSVAIVKLNLMDCPVKKGGTYRVIDNYGAALKAGDRIKAGIEFASSMGPNGPVNFLQWSPVVHEDGSPVTAKDGLVVTHFQGGF